MLGPLRATNEFGRRAPEGFLTHWPGPAPYSCPDPDWESHCAPPGPKRRRENPVWGDEAWGLMQPPDPASWCWEARPTPLSSPYLAPGTLMGNPWVPQSSGLWVGSPLGFATLASPMLWAPACLGKPVERAYQSFLGERQESRDSLNQKQEREMHSIFSLDVEKNPGNFLMEKEEGCFFLSEEEDTTSLSFLEAEERELVIKKETDWSAQQKLREDHMSLHFPRKEDEILSAHPKLDCFPKSETETKFIDMNVQEKYTKWCSPFALVSPLNGMERMERIIKTWQHWNGIPFEANMVMGPLSIYPDNPPRPASVEFLENPHTSSAYLYGNQSILKKDKWPHFINDPKTSGNLHPKCFQGA
ncbi:uncharacterized protein LOC141492731 [Macrotis lagotis]|uniref:uncharacterized protein LOC141492731 n=1 Tax=Macrotis lagotis TaxID=92651 RepID=UPI003D6863B1